MSIINSNAVRDQNFEEFLKYIEEYKIEYKDLMEFHKKFEVFSSNLELIGGHDSHGYSKFMDLTKEEFDAKFHVSSINMFEASVNSKAETYSPYSSLNEPDFLNYVDRGVVTPAKDQQTCGACWAFSAVGSVEAQNALSGNPLTSYSEQQLIDCDTDGKDNGCDGGLTLSAFEYIQENTLMTESSYPYVATSKKCKFKKNTDNVNIDSFKSIEQNEDTIKKALVELGPLSAGICSTGLQFLRNWDILMKKPTIPCPTTYINHAVVIVGYGTENGVDYWIIKNSWGIVWGKDGFGRIQRGVNLCGISSYVNTAIKKK